MKKNYVDKSYMNTQFRFGYFHILALRKLKNYSLTIFYNIHWSLEKNKNVKIQGMKPPNEHQMSRASLLWLSLFILFDVIQFAARNQLYSTLLLVFSFLFLILLFGQGY